MRTIAIIQARMSSTRLPEKVMMLLNEKTVIRNIVERITIAKGIDDIIVATSIDPSDDIIANHCEQNDIQVYRGNLNNVLERFYYCAKKNGAEIVVRCTADNPLIDGIIIDEAIKTFKENDLDYIAYKDSLPIGLHVEVFSFDALEKAYHNATDPECLEHVTPYIINNPNTFKVMKYSDIHDRNNSSIRLTMDTEEDYKLMVEIYKHFDNNTFSYEEIMRLLNNNPNLQSINAGVEQKRIKYKGE